jgi:hypothetical protein
MIDIIVHPIPFTETRILHEYGMLHIRDTHLSFTRSAKPL